MCLISSLFLQHSGIEVYYSTVCNHIDNIICFILYFHPPNEFLIFRNLWQIKWFGMIIIHTVHCYACIGSHDDQFVYVINFSMNFFSTIPRVVRLLTVLWWLKISMDQKPGSNAYILLL